MQMDPIYSPESLKAVKFLWLEAKEEKKYVAEEEIRDFKPEKDLICHYTTSSEMQRS